MQQLIKLAYKAQLLATTVCASTMKVLPSVIINIYFLVRQIRGHILFSKMSPTFYTCKWLLSVYVFACEPEVFARIV